jgi:hypothetical protein
MCTIVYYWSPRRLAHRVRRRWAFLGVDGPGCWLAMKVLEELANARGCESKVMSKETPPEFSAKADLIAVRNGQRSRLGLEHEFINHPKEAVIKNCKKLSEK